MAKTPKANKAGHPFIGKAGGLNYYRNDVGQITDEDGKFVGTGYQKVLVQQFPPVEQKESKETLEEAFPETYAEPREKKRTTRRRKKNTDVEQRSITLLTEIARNIAGGSSGGGNGGLRVPNIIKGFGWKGALTAGLGGLALGGIGGYLLNDYLSNDEEDAEELIPEEQGQAQQPSAGIHEAQQRGEHKTDTLTIEAKELQFNSSRLSFEVNNLTIDAEDIKIESKDKGSLGGGGGVSTSGGDTSRGTDKSSGGTGGTGNVGGAAAVGPDHEKFDANKETPASPGEKPGEMVPGGKGAFEGFTGKAPTPETVKEDLSKAQTFQKGPAATGPLPPGATFQSLTEEQKDRFLKQQAKNENVNPAYNNPGGMMWHKGLAKYGAVPGSFNGTITLAKFPSLEAGQQAQRDNWENNKNFKDVPLDRAIRTWTTGNPNGNTPAYYLNSLLNPKEKLAAPPVANVKTKQTEIPAGTESMLGSLTPGMDMRGKGSVSVLEPSKLSPAIQQVLSTAEQAGPSVAPQGAGNIIKPQESAPSANGFKENVINPPSTQNVSTPSAPAPEPPSATAPTITPTPQPQQTPAVDMSYPSAGLMEAPKFGSGPNALELDKAKFDISGPDGDVLTTMFTNRPHNAFLYLTPSMKTPTIGVGGG